MYRSHVLAFVVITALLCATFLFSRSFLKVPERTQDPTVFNNAYALVMKDYDGKDVHLYEFRRKILIAYSWASWCTYCADELKNLAKEKQLYANDIEIVAINRAEPLGEARAFTDRLSADADLNIPALIHFLLDPSDQFFKTISGYAMPETVFINEQGDIVHHQRGPIKIEDVDQKIKELLR